MSACRVVTAVILFAALFFSAMTRTHAQQRIAQVRFIVHGLQVQPAGGSLSRAHLKQPLFPAAFVRTRASEKASLGFFDGSELHINQRTDLVLRSTNLAVLKRGEGHFLV